MKRFAKACLDFAESMSDDVSWYGVRYMVVALSRHVCGYSNEAKAIDVARYCDAETIDKLCSLGEIFLAGRYREHPDELVIELATRACSCILRCLEEELAKLCRSE